MRLLLISSWLVFISIYSLVLGTPLGASLALPDIGAAASAAGGLLDDAPSVGLGEDVMADVELAVAPLAGSSVTVTSLNHLHIVSMPQVKRDFFLSIIAILLLNQQHLFQVFDGFSDGCLGEDIIGKTTRG